MDAIEKAHPLLFSWDDDHYYNSVLKLRIVRAIDLVKSVDDAMLVYCTHAVQGRPEQETALDKALSLCESVRNVKYVLTYAAIWASPSFNEEPYFAKIFKRGQEFAHQSRV